RFEREFVWRRSGRKHSGTRSCGWDAKEIFGEGPLRVYPLFFAKESGFASHLPDFAEPEFVARFGPNRLAFLQRDLKPRTRNGHGMADLRAEVHLDPALGVIVAGFVAEVTEIEIGVHLAVEPREKIQVERGRRTDGIVVSGNQPGYGFNKICSK